MATFGAIRTIVLRSTFSGISGLPQSRPIENDQSRVAIRPIAPAVWARSIRWTITSRSPVQYIWKKRARAGLDDLLDRLGREVRQPHQRAPGVGRPGDRDLTVGMHRLYAGRADQHRQRDLLAQHACAPSTARRGGRRRAAAPRARANAAWLSDDRLAALRAGDQRAVHRLRAAASARARWATATDSNQGFCFQGFSTFTISGLAQPARSPASGLSAQSLTGGRVISLSITGWLRVGLALEWSWLAAGTRSASPGQRRLAVPLHALGVRAVERQAGEELRRHAAAATGVVEVALRARAAGLRRAQVGEQLGVLPDLLEAAVGEQVAGQEVVVDRERAGVDVADRVDQADHAAGAAEVEAGQGLAERGEVEERVAGEHVVARAPSASRRAPSAARAAGAARPTRPRRGPTGAAGSAAAWRRTCRRAP